VFSSHAGFKDRNSGWELSAIRVFLAPDNTSISGNHCSSARNPANCVVLAADNGVHALNLASEAQSGLKIPSGQIAGGKFTIAAGETKDLDIDFNACASIVASGSGQFILKPVLHAVKSVCPRRSTDCHRQLDRKADCRWYSRRCFGAAGRRCDRVMLSTLADANGNFALCPVPAGHTTSWLPLSMDGRLLLRHRDQRGSKPARLSEHSCDPAAWFRSQHGPASLTGVVQTGGTSGAVAEIVTLSALQMISLNGSNVLVTIPLVQQSVATSNVTTASGASCSGGFDCIDFTLAVPGVNAFVGSFIGSGTLYVQSTVGSYGEELLIRSV